jgi:phospholipid/cholesterol/gamma-HCH transport system permease protein
MFKKSLEHTGAYLLMMQRVFSKPQKKKIFWRQTINEIDFIGLDSLGIVFIISIFMGAVIAIQTAYNIDTPLIPDYTVGYITKQSIVLEFSPTIVCLILAGKIGSRIASEIGSMRVSEQIDALEIMGINSANYLVLPKIVAAVFIIPILIIISIFLGVGGGWMIAFLGSESFTVETYVLGIRSFFVPFELFYAIIKTVFFAFIITSVSAYYGYSVRGGSTEVGKNSTKAVVRSSILIIFVNLVLTQLMLG